MSLLNPFIDLFEARGRYKVYEMLLREVTHSGVKGLLVQKLKDEVNNSLTLEVRGWLEHLVCWLLLSMLPGKFSPFHFQFKFIVI